MHNLTVYQMNSNEVFCTFFGLNEQSINQLIKEWQDAGYATHREVVK